ncbi:MAG: IS4 family transposase [Lacticaseibacillus paracasei]|nr:MULTISPECIES: IS4 family transposase [Lactobacillaceae]MDN6636632.1 IS4 family transposase [Lacticaseibacillus paracasei]MDN6765916.1 IS4 family transposase [Lactiplantibacillus plantarum]ATO56199.1 transposase [Loigolactobacillus coryniformis subsp. coryniformis KCTC 3167 = DSM 20001]MCE6032211.1 IS4 family transposase [Lactiplantibacillus pentosus]MCW3779753.1 IS4 family transposase [Levilactobacillus namurensis]
MLNPTNSLSVLDQIINETVSHIHDYTHSPQDFTRKRKLTAGTMIKTMLNMQGNSLNIELFNAFPGIDEQVSPSAFEQQKGKLKPDCFKHIFHQFNQQIANAQLLDHHYHVLAIDGSDFDLPWNPTSKYVCDFSKNKPYCQMHVNTLYDLLNKSYQDCISQPKTAMDERGSVLAMLDHLPDDSIVMMDRGYPSFNLIENLNRHQGLHYLIRAKLGGSIKEIQNLPDGECDQAIACRVTTSNHYYVTHKSSENIHCIQHYWHQYQPFRSKNTKDRRWDFGVFCTVKFRACKFQIGTTADGKPAWEVLITNLPAKQFPLPRMKRLYHLRWGIETAFSKLKYDLGAIQFHSKKDQFIEMELYANLIMYNVVSAAVNQAYVAQTNHHHWDTINFKLATRIVRYYYRNNQQAKFQALLIQLGTYLVPIRPGRKNKRRLKPKRAVSFVYRVA